MSYSHPRYEYKKSSKVIVRSMYGKSRRIKSLLQKSAWIFIISGVLSLLFGIVAIAWPGITLVVLVWAFAIPLLFQGIAQIVFAFKNRHVEHHWLLLFIWGLVNSLAAILSMAFPAITAFFLIMVMGATWLISGIVLAIAAIQLRKQIRNEGWFLVSAIISAVAGIYVLLSPGAGALSLIWLIAGYAILFGILLVIVGTRARNWGKSYFEEVFGSQSNLS